MEAARGQFVDGAWCDDEAGRDHGWQGPWLGGTMRSHTSSGVALRGHQEEQNKHVMSLCLDGCGGLHRAVVAIP
jgi:hypothetical protein